MKWIYIVLSCFYLVAIVSAQETPKPNRETQAKLKTIGIKLAAAQKSEDESEVRRWMTQAIEVLGDHAGIPEIADQLREIPKNAKQLTPKELPTPDLATRLENCFPGLSAVRAGSAVLTFGGLAPAALRGGRG